MEHGKRWGRIAAKALAAAALLGIGGVLFWASATPSRPAAVGEVVFLGDSITEYCDLAAYYPGLDAVNQGIAGEITDDMLRRMEWVYAAEPRIVVVHGGINDLLSGSDGGHIVDNLRAILQAVRQRLPEARIVLQSLYPIGEGEDLYFTGQIQDINEQLKALARELDCTYADVYAALRTEDGRLDGRYADDGLHPNDAGYRAACPVVLAAIQAAAR